MEVVVKKFSQLNTEELFKIYKLRVSVFVVEQKCAYQEIDDFDLKAYHIFIKDTDEILAYARVLPSGVKFSTVSIGRVIAVKRNCGLGSKILAEAISFAEKELKAKEITVEAQVYARLFYEKHGFRQKSEEFLIDGIPHIIMERNS